MFKVLTAMILGALLLTGCSGAPEPVISENQEPAWICKPNMDGRTGAVGSSKPQFQGGTSRQRRVAVSRALDEMAQQSGVEVGNIIMRNENDSGYSASASTTIESVQKTADVTINAHIEEIWTNPKTKELYVWLVTD